MKKEIIYTDEYSLNKRLEVLTKAAEAFNKLYKEFLTLKVFDIKTSNELEALVKGGENWVKDRIAEQLPEQSIGLFRLKRRPAVDLLDLPSFENLNQYAKECTPHLIHCSNMTIKGNSVIVSPMTEQMQKDQNTIYATNETEAEAFEAHKKLAEAITALKKIFPLQRDTKLQDLLTFEDHSQVKPRLYYWFDRREYVTIFRNKLSN